MGIPLPRGLVTDQEQMGLLDAMGQSVACDTHSLSHWPDGSLKWILVGFLVKRFTGSEEYHLEGLEAKGRVVSSTPILKGSAVGNVFKVDTGLAHFTVAKDWFHPWKQVELSGLAILAPSESPCLLQDAQGKDLRFRILRSEVGRAGSVYMDLNFEGSMEDSAGKTFCKATCRLTFFAGTALSQARFTLWNPRAAKHPGGLWDLGDPGSVLFKSFSLPIQFTSLDSAASLSLDPAIEATIPCQGKLDVFQASSGGENWQSRNHVNRKNQVALSISGFRVTGDNILKEGSRANPAGMIRHQAGTAAFALENFWQAFHNRIALTQNSVDLEPFPQNGEDYELQGGEKVTFSIWADFLVDPQKPQSALSAARLPLVAVVDPHWIVSSKVITGITSVSHQEDPFFAGLATSCLEGKQSLFSLRETYDEYGWRNFGEVAADHEKLHYKGKWEFVSHYNNQYDLVLSFLREFLRTGDVRWNTLGMDLGRHVIDHDLYHTSQDKPAYNGGYFWHTAHYAHAGMSTHRTFSRLCTEGGPVPNDFGGGPSNEHNYTSGLLLHYWLTGNEDSKEAVLMLARWVRDMQKGSSTPLRFLSRNPTGISTCTRNLDFQGPGRGAGYSVNACLDAYSLTGENEWLQLAEEFIHICIHPEDDCADRHLLDRENRWSYVIFLQILAKYLDTKLSLDQKDANFMYARAALLHYGDWMVENEVPNLSDPTQLEYPTSTWAAQDLRKTDVFLAAARYAEPEKEARYFARAEFFHAKAREYLESFDDRTSVRNTAIILYSLPAYREWKAGQLNTLNIGNINGPYLPRTLLIPQKIQFIRNAKSIVKTGGLAGIVLFARYLMKRSR